jgi:hypothetical protein
MLSRYIFEGPSHNPGSVNASSPLGAVEGLLATSSSGATSVGTSPFVPVLLSSLHDLSLTELYCTATTGMSEYGDCGGLHVEIVQATLDSEIMPGTDTTLGLGRSARRK